MRISVRGIVFEWRKIVDDVCRVFLLQILKNCLTNILGFVIMIMCKESVYLYGLIL